MRRFTYVSHSFTEEGLKKYVSDYASKENFKLDQICHGGALAFRLTSDEMIIEAVFSIKEKTIYIDVQAGINIDKSLEFIGYLSKNGFLKTRDIPYKNVPHECTGDLTDYVADVISRTKKPEAAIVYLSNLKNGYAYGYDIDEYRLAKRLYGIAHVITEGSGDDTLELHNRLKKSERWAPNNGYIGIYYPNGEYNILREPKTSSTEFDAERFIVSSIMEQASATAEISRQTFDKLLLKATSVKCSEVKVISNDKTLEAQLASRDKKIKELESMLAERNKVIEKLTAPREPLAPLRAPSIKEGRPGEFSDLMISALKHYRETLPRDKCKRAIDVADALILANPLSNYELKLLDAIEQSFKNGDIYPDFIKKCGFTQERQNGHFVFKYCGISQSLACTPSDYRTRMNELANFKHAFLVCH